MASQILTAERVLELLDYSPETGHFTWKENVGKGAGARARGSIAGYVSSRGYRYISIDRKNVFAHKLAWIVMTGKHPHGVIDHIDGDTQNNKWSNLRDTGKVVNGLNRKKASSNSKSGVLGAAFIKSKGKYRATIRVNGRFIHIGYFGTAKEAGEAYARAKITLMPSVTCPSL